MRPAENHRLPEDGRIAVVGVIDPEKDRGDPHLAEVIERDLAVGGFHPAGPLQGVLTDVRLTLRIEDIEMAGPHARTITITPCRASQGARVTGLQPAARRRSVRP